MVFSYHHSDIFLVNAVYVKVYRKIDGNYVKLWNKN